MKKEIKIKSNFKFLKNYIHKNFIFRVIKLLLNPVRLFDKIKFYENKKNKVVKINWKERVKKFRKYSVIDTQTPKEEFDYATNIQKKILFSNFKKYLNGQEKKDLNKVSNFLLSKLKKRGLFFLSEYVTKNQTNNNEILKECSSRNDNYYTNLFKKISLKKIDHYKYLQNETSIYIGKK